MTDTKQTAALKTFTFKLEAIGYETTTLTVQATTTHTAKINFERDAFKKFAERNAISMGDAKGFGFLTITKL